MKIELTKWEQSVLSAHAASRALTYISHDAREGLFDHEKIDMKRWKKLSEKLATRK